MLQFTAKSNNRENTVIHCRGKVLDIGQQTLIMGILNVTPDSFSDGGRYNSIDAAVARAVEMKRQGAHIIDIGGESTRPGYVPVSDDEEIARIVPVISAVSEKVDLPISIDTYKPKVAQAALDAGAHMINDIWGLKFDAEMAKIVADSDAAVVIMHNRHEAVYDHLVADVIADLKESLAIAQEAGIAHSRIILDPGIGFGKTVSHNLTLMNYLSDIVDLGYPVLLGTSRKSMIWKTLDLPVDQIVPGTIATVCMGIMQGCDIMRVHDVEEVAKACRMTDAMIRSGLREAESH